MDSKVRLGAGWFGLEGLHKRSLFLSYQAFSCCFSVDNHIILKPQHKQANVLKATEFKVQQIMKDSKFVPIYSCNEPFSIVCLPKPSCSRFTSMFRVIILQHQPASSDLHSHIEIILINLGINFPLHIGKRSRSRGIKEAPNSLL